MTSAELASTYSKKPARCFVANRKLLPTSQVLTNLRSHATVITEITAMMRKPHTDCFPTPATFMWQGAGKGTFM